jgi:ribosomal protein S18 acetylase RimI-like enzyme
MPRIEVRSCRSADLPAVLDLMQQLGEIAHSRTEYQLQGFEQMAREMDKYPEVYLNLVAECDGRVAGFLSLMFYKTFLHRVGTALINELVVDEKVRGAGIGGALLQRAKEEALARHMDELEVCTDRDNLAAQQFYRTHGFDGEYVLFGMEFEE